MVFGALNEEEVADVRNQAELALSVPELRAAVLDQFAQTMRAITEVLAERTGRAGDDFAVETLAGAILGVMISAEFHWVEHPETDLMDLLDDGLERLQSGLRL